MVCADPATGGVTVANRYAYLTWGTPTTTPVNGYSDLGFRYLYVGAADVQWDNSIGQNLFYMHARTYSPVLGRFLQPDPARADGNLYAYAGNSPVSKTDPSGLIAGSGWGQRIYSSERIVSWLEVSLYSLGPGAACAAATARRINHPGLAALLSVFCGVFGNMVAPRLGDKFVVTVYRSCCRLTVYKTHWQLGTSRYLFDSSTITTYKYHLACERYLTGRPMARFSPPFALVCKKP